MTKTVYRVLWWALTLAWCGCIVYLSLQDAPQSAALSSGLTKRILEWFSSYRALSVSQQAVVLLKVQDLVRELAHVAEYTVLGALTTLLARSYRVRSWLVVWGATAAFAVMDECLQEFATVGRAFQVIDLIKDWLGAFLGIGCVWLVCLIAKRAKHKKE